MTLELQRPALQELKPRITVIGVGGAGGNAVNNMIKAGLAGVDFVVANTDAQALTGASAENRIQLGLKITQGLGAGSRPEIGRAAAEETFDQIELALEGSHMCFITAGMGGGTGTGAAPIVAKAAREKGILTVAVVTKPFAFEGARRMRLADEGIAELQKHVDTLIIIPNQNLFRIATPHTTFQQAFAMADDVLHSGVRSITDLMVMPGLINLDFADVRTVMSEMGKAMMGTGAAEGEGRAMQAAQAAIANPLLDDVSLRGAKGVIINIAGSHDLTLFEVDEAANHIREMVDPDANIIVGSAFDPSLEGIIRVSVVATGIDAMVGHISPARAAGSSTQVQSAPRAMAAAASVPAAPTARTMAPAAPAPASANPTFAASTFATPTFATPGNPFQAPASATPRGPYTNPPAQGGMAAAPASPQQGSATGSAITGGAEEDVLALRSEEAVGSDGQAAAAAYRDAPMAPAAPLPLDESTSLRSAAPAPVATPMPVDTPTLGGMRMDMPPPLQQPTPLERSPSLFERMTIGLRGGSKQTPAAPATTEAKDAETKGGKGDDPFEIPTFLRRQANN